MSIMMVHFNCQLTQPRFIWEETINVALAMLGGTTDMSVENCPKKLIFKSRHTLNVISTIRWA